MMSSLFQTGSLWIWTLLALGLVIAFVVVILSALIRRSGEPEREPAAPEPSEGAPAEDAEESRAPGRVRVESASESFRHAMRFLRGSVAGRDYRYQIPWYLVVGDPGSGKTTLLGAAGLNLAPEEGGRNVRRSLEWTFLDRGVLIGTAGAYFKGGAHRDEYDWGKLLRLLRNGRPRRPLDGIILTVPAADLYGPEALDETQLSARAARYSELLAQAQRQLGFTFPVYVVVTKCDRIEGYSSFCSELPGRASDDIFGWSSPYHLEASFTAEWVDEAFDSIAGDLQRLQSEIFVERSELKHPDEVFLFPEELAVLRSPMRVYLERLFRETAYREAFRFRGIYFSGDLAEAPPPPAPVPAMTGEEEEEDWMPRIAPVQPSEPAPPPRRTPAFLRKLFDQKIFPENGLARPLGRVFLAKSRTVMTIQLVSAGLALILGLGTWLSWRWLASDRAKLEPALRMMTKSPDGQSLLQALVPAGPVHFRSLFIPASWFATTDDEVTDVMTYACNRWIVYMLHDGLVARKQALLYKRPKPAAAALVQDGENQDAEEALVVPNIEATAEYQQLDHYVSDLKSFRDNVGYYDNLRQRGQVQDVERMRMLLGYLKLTDVQPVGHLAAALSRSSGPPVEMTAADRNTANDTIKTLIGELFKAWFENNPLLDDTDQLRQEIVNLEQGRIKTYDDLKRLLDAINQVDSDFSSPTFRWASSPTLDLSGPLERVALDPIDPGGRAVPDYAREIGEGYLTELRKSLFDERTSTTDALLVRDPIVISPGVKQLQMALQNAMNLRFMTNGISQPRPIRYTMDENTRLMWRIAPVQEALRLDDIYNQFINDGLRGAPRQLTAVMRRVTSGQLEMNEQDLIAQAQEFSTRPTSRDQANGDDETLAEVNSFRDASEPLLRLAQRMQALGATDQRNATMRILVLQAYNLLSVLDRRLRNDNPYAAKPGNWRGQGSVALASYEVRNTAALNEYLSAQRARIKFLEQQSEPLVPFLNTWLPVRAEVQNRLVTKWQEIIEDFRGYDAKRPGASLTALEDFILTGMDKILPESGCKGDNLGGRDQGSDYFTTIRSNLWTNVTERCRDLSAETVCRSYSVLEGQFNSTLAGRFPFAALTPGKPQPEATPEALTAFYQLLDRNGKTARSTLNEEGRFGEASHAAIRFLDQMEALRPLVAPASPDAPKEPPLTLDLIPQFRSNRPNESEGNQIIDWTMQVGGQIFRQRDPEHPGRWRQNNPIRLSLRWATDSVYIPAADGQPNLHIRDRNAYFEFTDRWSLYAFLRQMQAPPSEVTQAEKTPYTLKFRVKTARDPRWAGDNSTPATRSATVFMHMSIFLPGTKNAIPLPAFPVSAPSLGSACGKE